MDEFIRRLFHFARQRLSPGQRYGLGFTAALVLVALTFWGFLETVESWTEAEDFYRIDGLAASLADTIASPGLTTFFRVATFAGSAWVAVPLVLVAAWVVWRWSGPPPALFTLTTFGLGQALLYVLKLFFQRARPELQLVAAHGYSFPSGHSFTSALLYGVFMVLLWHARVRTRTRVAGTCALALLILLTGTSRVYLGVHYATDVVGGFLLALGWVAASAVLARFLLPPTPPKEAV